MQQPHAQMGFEQCDCLARGLRGHALRCRRATEAAELGSLGERLDRAQFVDSHGFLLVDALDYQS
jgi:hypothetical protein